MSDTRFALPPFGAGTYTFLIKAVDVVGGESRDAAILVTDLVGTTPQNIVGRYRLQRARLPGTWESLHYEDEPPPGRLCNDLLADGPHWTQDSARYWIQDWYWFWTDKYAAGCYTIAVDVAPEDVGTTLTLDWTGTGPWTVEYLGMGTVRSGPPIPRILGHRCGDVLGTAGPVAAVAGRHHRERATLLHPVVYARARGSVSHARRDRLRRARHRRVPRRLRPAGGAHPPAGYRSYREILNVQLTVVQSVGAPVRVVDVLDKDRLGRSSGRG